MVYTIKEISEKLGIHIRTIQRWAKEEGLEVKNLSSKPHLIEGKDIKKFLKDRSAKQKTILKRREFYCMKCQKAVKAKDDKIQFEFKNKILGRGTRQIYLRGKCEHCSGKLVRLSSSDNIIQSGF